MSERCLGTGRLRCRENVSAGRGSLSLMRSIRRPRGLVLDPDRLVVAIENRRLRVRTYSSDSEVMAARSREGRERS